MQDDNVGFTLFYSEYKNDPDNYDLNLATMQVEVLIKKLIWIIRKYTLA